MTKVIAKLNHLHVAPRKVRLVASALKGLSVNEAEAQLLFRPQRSGKPLLQLLRSAIANAKNNYKLNTDNLFIESIRVDQGPMMKRFLPRAMGRATPIQKKTSHVLLIVEDREKAKAPRFNIAEVKKAKLPKKEKAGKVTKPKLEIEKHEQKPKEKVGFFKKIFQRKSV
ncbi:MAG: 50S ribosomal protein L22 [Candidatus Harrisonbacteria bacterium]|nr:50S ribosomal protein L22 [Candidatus Harrisonbacteria bacterium]